MNSIVVDMSHNGRVQDIVEKAMSNRNALLSEYILEYLLKTTSSIEELTIVEQMKDNKVLLYLAKKSDLGV